MKKTGGVVMESALYEILRYGVKYHEPVSHKHVTVSMAVTQLATLW